MLNEGPSARQGTNVALADKHKLVTSHAFKGLFLKHKALIIYHRVISKDEFWVESSSLSGGQWEPKCTIILDNMIR
jgi:hypothetical protein